MNNEMLMYVGGGVLSVIVWGVRLEGKVKSLERENEIMRTALQSVENSHNNLSLKVVEQLGVIREALARIEGRMGDGRT